MDRLSLLPPCPADHERGNEGGEINGVSETAAPLPGETGALVPSDAPGPPLVALDIGGANLKAADGRGWCHAEPFAMWREHHRLAGAIRRMLHSRNDCRRVVVTMTGEIADCFQSREHGVHAIVTAVEEACQDRALGIYLVDGSFVSPAEAKRRFREAAASNWHALATLAARLVRPAGGLLVDVGSTTVDVVWVDQGTPRPRGLDDVSRLACGELVYTGVERTPVAAIVHELPWQGRLRPVARERFADAQDAWLLLGLPLDATCDTADGRPLDAVSAAARLARMLLLDPADFTRADALAAAESVAAAQTREISGCMQQVVAAAGRVPEVVVLSGHGGLLAGRCLDALGWHECRVLSLAEQAGDAASRVGPAHALALIASGRLG